MNLRNCLKINQRIDRLPKESTSLKIKIKDGKRYVYRDKKEIPSYDDGKKGFNL